MQLNCGHRPDRPNVCNRRMIADGIQSLAMNLCDHVDALEHRLALENTQARNASGSGEGITGIGMAVVERATSVLADERVVNCWRANRGTHGEDSTRQPFR